MCLASKEVKARSKLRITRLFVSANDTDLEAVRGIINHPEFSKSVKEVIWDDARLERYYGGKHPGRSHLAQRVEGLAVYNDRETQPRDPGYMQRDFENFYASLFNYQWTFENWKKDETLMERREKIWGERFQHISLEERSRIYQCLYAEQEEIIASGADIETFRSCLVQLLNLKRVTITTQIWESYLLYSTLYDTPLFRRLPPGFVMPTPRNWKGDCLSNYSPLNMRDLELLRHTWKGEHPHETWRGYSVVVSELLAALPVYSIEEFLIDVHKQPTGHVFS